MKHLFRGIFVLVILVACFVVVRANAATVTVAKQPRYVASNRYPVLLVHGFNSQASVNCAGSAFPHVPAYVAANGWQGAIMTVGFYAKDTNCTVNLTTYQGYCTRIFPGNVGTINEDLRHVACELAWYIYNTLASHGDNVQMVAHSMGGLIVRAVLANLGHAGWPSKLYVQDAVTMGTPHGGLLANSPIIACGKCWQGAQMTIGSSFLATLAQNPQASNGTDWTMQGSDCDTVTWTSTTAMFFGHKVEYHTPCYVHGGYLSDTSNTEDALVNWSVNMPTSVLNQRSSTWPHSLHLVLLALESAAW